ncbi:hypothetical protein LUW77_03165 [Streptomyces radiopugnans]|nr:hypothetical protein LUW77_03165 [Streptomyces radiopugnans]
MPDLTVDYDPAAENPRGTAFETAVTEHAIPHLKPVLEQMGRPELADCAFIASTDRTTGHFLWADLAAGQIVRFCAARITTVRPVVPVAPQARDNHVA